MTIIIINKLWDGLKLWTEHATRLDVSD